MKIIDLEDKTKEIISGLSKCKSIKNLELLLSKDFLKKGLKDKRKYPSLGYNIPKAEIERLKHNGWIDINNQLVVDKFSSASTMEKLLFSIIWKRGDLRKISKIIDGIEGENVSNSERITFNKFGEFLLNPATNIIIDQHVIRAYQLIEFWNADKIKPNKELTKIRKKDILTGKDKELINGYKNWIRHNTLDKAEIKQDKKYLGLMDELLFAFGKIVKL